MTGQIKCCYGCVAPKRHIGCHASCPEYRAEEAATKPRPGDEAHIYLSKRRQRLQHILRNKGQK